MTENLYLNYLHNALSYYVKDEDNIKYFSRIPKSRDISFKFCLDYINNLNKKDENIKDDNKIILELGTSRSFTDGRFPEGCNKDDPIYWEPNNPEKWDWSAGCFTRFFSELTNKNVKIITVDLSPNHINRCKIMTNDYKDKIKYIVNSSENVLMNLPERSVHLLYLDTGDMTPIEHTAQLHLREAKIIVEKNILTDDGIILIDDVRHVTHKINGET